MKGNQMQEPSQPEWLTTLVVLLLSMVGGFVRWINKIREERRLTKWLFIELIIQLITSGFVGIVVWYLCLSANLDPRLTAALIAISGNMGIHALKFFEEFIKGYAKR